MIEGSARAYGRLVNTTALPFFLDARALFLAGLSPARKKLRWTSVYNLNIGVARAGMSDNLDYFPERSTLHIGWGIGAIFPDFWPRRERVPYI